MADLQIGAKAPPLDGIEQKSGSAASPMVIVFYPRAGSPACTTEVVDFSSVAERFAKLGVRLVAVSPDKPMKVENFGRKHGVAFPLLADPDMEIARAWGVWVEKSMYGRAFMGVERATFLIDAKGTVAEVWRNVKVPGHAEAVLAAAEALAGRRSGN